MANVIGTPDKDMLIGGAGADILKGEAGNDLLDGKSGADLMMGDAGDDLYIVDSGGDVVFENAGAGHDTVRASVSHVLAANVEDLVLVGTSGIEGHGNDLNNSILGNVANNALRGNAGDDVLNGDAGNDMLAGGAGSDHLIGGAGQDVASYSGVSHVGNGIGFIEGRLSVIGGAAVGIDTLESIEQLAFEDALIRIGTVHAEFRVNRTTTNHQESPTIAALADGGFVVIWESFLQDGAGFGLYAQRYDAAGTAMGGEFRVNSHVASDQTTPSVATLVGGGFVIAWTSANQDGEFHGIYAQRYGAGGTAVGAEFRVNDSVAGDQIVPTIAALTDGGFIVAWTSEGQDGSGSGIYAQRYNANGTTAGAEFRVNDTSAGDQTVPTISALPDGGFVVVWTSQDQGGIDDGIYAQRYDAVGTVVGAEFRLNSHIVSLQTTLSVATLSDGGFVVSWTSMDQDTDLRGVYAQRYDVGGTAVDAEFRVNDAVASDQVAPTIVALMDGGFVVTWSSLDQNGVSQGIYAQRYDAAGSAMGAEFRVNSTAADMQSIPTIAALSDGGFVVTWTSSGREIYAQRYNADGTVASIEGDGGDNTLSFTGGSAQLAGGLGRDTYLIDDSGDQVIEGSNAGVDTVQSSVDFTLSSDVENLTLGGTANINGTGNTLGNTITGNSGNNVLDGGLGIDRLVGAAGNDEYLVTGGDVVIEAAGGGIDTVSSSFSYRLENNVENLQLVGAANSINGTGNELNNAIAGSYGDNLLDGASANDTLDGSFGNDTLIGGAGNDRLIGAAGQDTALYNLFADSAGYRFGLVAGELTVIDVDATNGSEGTDTLESVERITMGASTFTFTPSDGVGSPNLLIGNASNNTLSFTGASAQLEGGLGDDTYFIDDVGDQVVEGLSAGTDTVRSGVTFALSNNVEHLTLTGVGNINGTGNGLINTVTGNGGNNILNGGLGNDRMVGGGGNDVYVVDNAGDVIVELAGGGIDLVNASLNYTLGVELENLVLAGSAFNGAGNALNNALTGNALVNTLNGAAGNDTLNGEAGNDSLFGREGNDRLIGGEGLDTAVYTGPIAGYRIGLVGGALSVIDFDARNGLEGTDTLEGIERISFTDGQIQIGVINSESEFQVNTFSAGNQDAAAIAGLAGGGFVVTWTSSGQDGNGTGVYAQRYAADGVAAGAEFRVNNSTVNNQDSPTVAALADGGFVLIFRGQDGSGTGVFAQRYDAAGVATGAQFLVNSNSIGNQSEPSVTALADGGLVVAWNSGNVFAQRYDAAGLAQGVEFRVNSTAPDTPFSQPTVAAMEEGGFVVAWTSSGRDVQAQRYDADGLAQGAEFRVNSFTTGMQADAGIGALADGGFVVTWMSEGQDGSSTSVHAQRYDAGGVAVGTEFRVNNFTEGHQYGPAVAGLSDGGFVVTWTNEGLDGASGDIQARRYDASGAAVGGEFIVNSTTAGFQFASTIAALPDGGFVITWTSSDQDGGGNGVYAQRYDADGEPVSTGAGTGNGTVLLEGGNGNDALSFTGGSAQLEGGLGNDTYFVDDGGDVVVETLNAGTDSVQSSITFTLSENVEHLTLTGSQSINGTGNALNNTITGSFGNNILSGGLGNDRLVGGDGNDYYIVNGGDVVVETEFHGNDTVEASINFVLGTEFENLRLTGAALNGTGNALGNRIAGNALANTLNGGAGNDTLTGGLGNDTLIGGANNDTFVFSSALGANIDRILDFNAVADTIILDNDVFNSSMQVGTLNPFLYFAGTVAHDVNDRIIYDSSTGKLFYDADGNGAGAAVQFATLNPGTVLSNVDFLIVA